MRSPSRRDAGRAGHRSSTRLSARDRAERLWRESVVRSQAPGDDGREADTRRPSDTSGDAGTVALLPGGPAPRKLRALWISAYDLGVSGERSDQALAAWLRRRTGLDAAACTTPAGLARAVAALETWLARAAGVDWRPHLSLSRNGRVRETRRPRARVLEAQWRLLHRQGGVRLPSLAALGAYAARHAGLGRADSHLALTDPQADALIRHFGRRIRALPKARVAGGPGRDIRRNRHAP